MAILHPLAGYYNTPEKYQILKNWCEAQERASGKAELNVSFEKELESELLKVKNTIDKSISKIFN